VRTANRDGLIDFLKSRGIGTGIHYPVPLHLQKAYEFLNYTPADFPVATQLAAEIVSLPMFPHLTKHQQQKVADEIVACTATFGAEAIVSEEQIA
jgi:dTDP-4-amino-4,6-dideoxygalactose transaminase